MKYTPIIQQIKSYCPIFGMRVAGAAEFSQLKRATNLEVPCAYVIPLDGNPGQNQLQNDYKQPFIESFAVIVIVDNKSDERGQTATESLHDIQRELWKALLTWEPPGDEHQGIEFQGENLEAIDRDQLHYRYEFGAEMTIGTEDTWRSVDEMALPSFTGATIKVDATELDKIDGDYSPTDADIDHTLNIQIPEA